MAIICGVGAQAIYMAVVILVTIIMGLINPFMRAWCTYQSFFGLAAGAIVNGGTTQVMMKFFGSKDWMFSGIASAVVLPMYLLINFMLVELIEDGI